MSNKGELRSLRQQNKNLELLLEKERDLRIHAERLVSERFLKERDRFFKEPDDLPFPEPREAMRRILKQLDKLCSKEGA